MELDDADFFVSLRSEADLLFLAALRGLRGVLGLLGLVCRGIERLVKRGVLGKQRLLALLQSFVLVSVLAILRWYAAPCRICNELTTYLSSTLLGAGS